MARLFDEHILRQTKPLSGTWKFKTDEGDVGLAEQWYLGLENAESVTVPSLWNNESGLLDYEGAAWYQKQFHTNGGCLRFVFEAVMTSADVWLDGTHLGTHYGGFTAFDFIVRNVSAGMHTLSVRADNRFDEHSIPQKKVDWYHYGGIPRDVSVETLSGIAVLSCRLEYELNDALDRASCRFVATLYNADEECHSSTFSASVGDVTVSLDQVTLSAGETQVLTTQLFDVSSPRLWDPDSPILYPISVYTDTDDLIDRIGFRKIEIRDGQILLNGRKLELRGANRHEEHPDWGFAFPPKLMKKDLDIAFDLGCNALRGSHYPNSKIFLDLLDERGMLFWSEIPIWGCGFSEAALTDPIVISRGLEMHREMLEQYYNHPSIIIWGMHNEILTNTESALPITKCYYDFLKKNGGNRLVTYASHKPMEDICFEYCDMICINLYFGWYQGKISSWDAFVNDLRDRRDLLGFSEKPVVISEFGAAALYGHHTFDNIPWTEEYQAELFTHCIELFHGDPMIVGCYIWQFCDIRTAPEMGLNRARGFNNKGILNEFRKPKSAYRAIKTLYTRYRSEERRFLPSV